MAESGAMDPVRRQYELLPYPHREPEAERHRLLSTPLDDLEVLNQLAFRGTAKLTKGFRVLVAGGGTGDATIFLAEQLRDTDARIVHLDLSSASIEVAQARARIRGLENVEFRRGSLLELRPDGGVFDYINCVGVLHHLPEPPLGLAALEGVLAPQGVLGAMLYGQYGRAAVYQVQSLLRRIHTEPADTATRLSDAREVLAALPDHHWFNLAQDRHRGEVEENGDAALFDLLLHAQDRAYTVPQLRVLLKNAGLPHATFLTLPESPVDYYEPASFLSPGPLLERVSARSLWARRAIAEQLYGGIAMHLFYATRQPDRALGLTETDAIPFFRSADAYADWPQTLATLAERGSSARLRFACGPVEVPLPEGCAALFRHLDGRRTLGQLLQKAAKGDAANPRQLLERMLPTLQVLHQRRLLLMRRKTARLPARLAGLTDQLTGSG